MIPDWNTLRLSLAGRLVRSEDDDYDSLRRVYTSRFDDVRPAAIVRCASESDVVASIGFARRSGIALTIRSGGHSYAGCSSGSGMILDVRPMNAVRIDGAIARMGAGTNIGDVCDGLAKDARMLPTGMCLSVGMSGSALGGGIGLLGRRYGLTLDSLTDARIVLADGRVLRCSDAEHRDLFWALRGAGGGSFGVVTELGFRTVPAEVLTSFFCPVPFAAAARFVAAWLAWLPQVPEAMSHGLVLSASGDLEASPRVILSGAMVGTESESRAVLAALFDTAGVDLIGATFCTASFHESVRYWGTELTTSPSQRSLWQGYRCTRSEYFVNTLPAAAIDALLENFARQRVVGQQRGLELVQLGGAYDRVARDATAYWHRGQRYLLAHKCAVDTAALEADKAQARRFVVNSCATVHQFGSGTAYQNYPDPDGQDSLTAYYGDHLDRLIETKRRYDPESVFRHALSIPTQRSA